MSNSVTRPGRETVPGGDATPEQILADLYRQYGRMVRRIAAVTLNWGDAALVDDIAQDTWLQVWTCLQRGADLTNRPAAGLIATITRRMVGMHYRRVSALKRPRTTPRDFSNGTPLDPATASTEDVALAELSALDRLCARLQAVTA